MPRKILFYCETKWAFGAIHYSLCKELKKLGWEADIKDWSVGYVISEFQAELDYYDYIATPDTCVLVDSYSIPYDKIIFIAHDESDLQKILELKGVDEFSRYAGFGVVSDTLASSSLSIGIGRVPNIARLGVDFEKYFRPISSCLQRVGYATVMSRSTRTGVERKRGHLAKIAAESVGLAFLPALDLHFNAIPDYYASIDSLLMSSLQEGAGLPPLEAAAAGRLVIGTPVGHFPRLAYEGLGVLAPLGETAFVNFVSATLAYYKFNPSAYTEACEAIQRAAKARDWSLVVSDWVDLIENAR